jgi:putative inorganic carbon (HCO3(-)) transporter
MTQIAQIIKNLKKKKNKSVSSVKSVENRKICENLRNLRIISFLGLAVMAPLMLFPRGVLPWIGLLLAVGLFGLRWRSQGWPRLGALEAPLLLLAGMALLGMAITIQPELSWPRWWSLLYGWVVFAVLRQALALERDAAWIASGLALLGLGLAAVSLVGTDWSNLRFFELPGLYERLPNLLRGLPGSGIQQPGSSDLFNPRWVGITMGVLAPVYLPLLRLQGKPWLRLLLGLAFLATAGMVLLAQSIQGLLGLAAGVFVVLIFISPWFWLLLPAGGLALAGVLWRMGPQGIAAAFLTLDNAVGKAVVLRLDIWSRAWAMLQDMPFTGIGLNVFPVVQSEFYTGYIIGPEPHAHNLYLQTALDLGLPGLAAFAAFIGLWAMSALRAVRSQGAEVRSGPSLLLIAALAGVASYLAHGLVDAMMLGAKPGFVVWALLGIGAAHPLAGSHPHPDPHPDPLPDPHPNPLPGRERGQAEQDSLAPVGRGPGDFASLPVSGEGKPGDFAPLPFREGGGGGVGPWPLLALFALLALLFPGKVWLNLGTLQAMGALHPFPQAAPIVAAPIVAAPIMAAPIMARSELARLYLDRALQEDPMQPQPHLLLGRLEAAAGRVEAAQEHYRAMVALDLQQQLISYNPVQALRLGLGAEAEIGPPGELLKIYQAWNTRFPRRAEGYLLKAILLGGPLGDPAAAQNSLQAGLQAGALPEGLLR